MSVIKEVIVIVERKLTYLGILFDGMHVDDIAREVEQTILNYCNICKVPYALRYVWANMIVDYLRWEAEIKKKETSDENPGDSNAATIVSSIRTGDTVVQFVNDSNSIGYATSYAHNMAGVLDAFIMNYRDQLNKYRRLV